MPKKQPKPKPASGGARLVASGKRAMLLGLSPEDRDLIERAAKADSRPMTQFVRLAAVAAAKKILGNPAG